MDTKFIIGNRIWSKSLDLPLAFSFKHLKFLLALLTTQITLLYTIYLGVIPC